MGFDYRRGFIVNPDAVPGGIEDKAPYVDHGTGLIDPRRYYSADEAKREWDTMWTKTWIFAGLVSDIPEIGDYFTFELGRAPILVVRAAEDEIRAMYNVCPHRGNTLVKSDSGTIPGHFHCGFHGWEFELTGALRSVRDRELFRPETLDGCQGLTPIRCETWAGTVFICLDAAAAPLSDYLDVIPAHLKAYPFERFRPFRDLWLVWDANWKTALDAFAEFYHGEDVHPEAKVMSEGYALQYDQYRNGHGRMIIANGLPSRFKDGDQVAEPVRQFLRFFGGDPDLYPDSHGRGFRAALVDTKRRWAQRNELDYFKQLTDGQVVDDWNYYFFPNMTWNVFSESLLIQRFFPHPTDPSKSIYNAITLAIPVKDPDYAIFDLNDYGPEAHKKGLRNWDGTERPPREWITDFTKLGYVLEQDARLIPDVQRGIESPNYRGHRLSESELRIRHYLAELDLYLAGRK